MIEESYYRTSVKAVIYNENWEILLCKEDSWKYDFPGWWLDHWEKIEDCLKRELKEEMWIEIISFNKTPKEFIAFYDDESKKHPLRTNVFYEVKVKNLDFKPSEECVSIWFFNKETVKNIKSYKSVYEFFENLT